MQDVKEIAKTFKGILPPPPTATDAFSWSGNFANIFAKKIILGIFSELQKMKNW